MPSNKTWYEKICEKFNKAECECIVVGGVASAFYGSPRMTMDLDFYIDWSKKNIMKIVSVFSENGFTSLQPISISNISSRLKRKRLFQKKGCVVWTFVHKKYPEQVVDLIFDIIPESFIELKNRAIKEKNSIAGIPIISFGDLLKMKRRTGRKKDIEDIETLMEIETARLPRK